MVAAEPTLRQVAVRTVVAGLILRLRVAAAVTQHLRVAAALIPRPAAGVAILHRAPVAVAAATVVGAAAVMLPAAVAATAADIDKLTLFVSPKTGAAAGTSTQPAAAPAFLLSRSQIPIKSWQVIFGLRSLTVLIRAQTR